MSKRTLQRCFRRRSSLLLDRRPQSHRHRRLRWCRRSHPLRHPQLLYPQLPSPSREQEDGRASSTTTSRRLARLARWSSRRPATYADAAHSWLGEPKSERRLGCASTAPAYVLWPSAICVDVLRILCRFCRYLEPSGALNFFTLFSYFDHLARKDCVLISPFAATSSNDP